MKKNIKYFAIALILLCCLMGAASAAEDVSADIVDASDDAVVVDAVSEDVDDSLESLVVEEEPVVDDSAVGSIDDAVVVDTVSEDESLELVDDSSSEDVLGRRRASSEIYVNMSNPDTITGRNANDGSSWENAYGGEQAFMDAMNYIVNDDEQLILGKIILADGEYSQLDLPYDKYCHVIGFGNQVIFKSDNYYNLDLGSNENYANGVTNFRKNTAAVLFVHENIIFDCDVKVGSKNFKFINCTFKKGLTISHDYQFNNEFTPGEQFSDTFSITFENCTFVNPKSDIVIADKNVVEFDEDCTFPVTAVDSLIDISSPEKGTIVITLTDNSTNPIVGATIKYNVNDGENQTTTTVDGGKATITGLTGEVTIFVSYEGNESYNSINDTKVFNFTEEPASNDTATVKVATKLTAAKVTATYNVAKKLVITLTDKNGKALANKKVSVKVGSISKTLTTDKNGKVSLNVATLVPKTYTATVKFAGDNDYTASAVSPKVVVSKAKVKLAAKAKTFKVKVKTKKYIVTLKNNKGKAMKKVKLTLKVGKKTYKATTNSKGKATFKITKLTKKGKYTATIKFAGSKYYKAASKKVKITVKK